MSDRTLNIVLVDDDDVDVMNVQRAFTKGHIPHPIYVAQDGISALALYWHFLTATFAAVWFVVYVVK